MAANDLPGVDQQEHVRGRLRLLLEQRKISQKTLADLAKVHPQTVNRWLTGKMGISLESLRAIGNALGVSVEWFLSNTVLVEPDLVDAMASFHGLGDHEERLIEGLLREFTGLSQTEQRAIVEVIEVLEKLDHHERVRVAESIGTVLGGLPSREKLMERFARLQVSMGEFADALLPPEPFEP